MKMNFAKVVIDIRPKYSIFQQYNAVPPTPLLTSDVLKEENEQWPDVQQGMSLALREMRVDQVRFLSKINLPEIVVTIPGPDNYHQESKDQLKLSSS
jgi:hypothetical protein